MKIKTKVLPYEKAAALPRPEHKPPRRPSPLLRALVRTVSAGDLKKARFSYTEQRMDALGPGPYLILMNHSSFIDLEIAAEIFHREPYCIVCTSDGFVGKEGLMRAIGCIPTNKFVTDLSLLADMSHALREERCSVLLYPEASYSFDGRATPLPRKMGVMLKKLDVPVVGVLTRGAFTRDPLYNCLQKRDVTVSAEVTGLFTREELRQRSVAELDAALDEMFSFDNFAWQAENGVVTDEPFRADGLHRILYKCPHCLRERAPGSSAAAAERRMKWILWDGWSLSAARPPLPTCPTGTPGSGSASGRSWRRAPTGWTRKWISPCWWISRPSTR